jgi:DNA polymerase-3 subunit alpha
VDSRSLNKRVMESLVKSGAFDSLGWKRSQCMTMIDTAIEYGQKSRRDRESGQKGLFANLMAAGQTPMSEPPPPDIPEWPLEQRLLLEKETLGFYVSGHPLDRFASEIARFSKKSIAELVSEGKSVECKIAGIITDFRARRTKKGDLMAIFSLEDLSGAVETVVFPSAYQKFEPFMTSDFPVLVSGRFEKEDERSCKLIASDLQPLSGINQRYAKTLLIKARLSDLNPKSATELHRLLESNRGDTGVEVELYDPKDFRVNIESADFIKVKSSPELIQQIETICGSGSVHVLN